MHVDSTSSEWSSSGQSNSLSEHKMNFSETPSQSFPPFSGLGFVQDLFDTRILEPDRHEQSDQSENSVQLPSITLGMVRDALRLGNASFITLSLFIFRVHTPLLHHWKMWLFWFYQKCLFAIIAYLVPFQIHTMFLLMLNGKPMCNGLSYNANPCKYLVQFALKNVYFSDRIAAYTAHLRETFLLVVLYHHLWIVSELEDFSSKTLAMI